MRKKVAAAWLRKEDWPRWQSIDDQLPAYERWRAKIEAGIAASEGRGLVVEKVEVHIDQFLAWCRARRRTVDRDARAAYAAEVLARRMTDH